VRVEVLRDQGRALVGCGNCGIKDEFLVKHAQSEIDVYCMFTDKTYGGSSRLSVQEVERT
jgi:transcription elongation factor Elf1